MRVISAQHAIALSGLAVSREGIVRFAHRIGFMTLYPVRLIDAHLFSGCSVLKRPNQSSRPNLVFLPMQCLEEPKIRHGVRNKVNKEGPCRTAGRCYAG
jgi:hypothetical protein